MFEGMDTYETAFWIFAVAGTTLFVLKTLMMIVAGMEHGSDVDADGSDVAFKLLSINSVTGFFMMFGWVGLAAYKQAELSGGLSVVCGFLAGLFAMYLISMLFLSALKLVSSGTQYRIEDTVGKQASVYEAIPAQGNGRIQVVLEDITRCLLYTSPSPRD